MKTPINSLYCVTVMRFCALVMWLLMLSGCTGSGTFSARNEGKPAEVTQKEYSVAILPWENYEECLTLSSGSDLRYDFQSEKMLAFDIHYHVDEVTMYSLPRRYMISGDDNLPVPVTRRYCLYWENPNTTIVYLHYQWRIE